MNTVSSLPLWLEPSDQMNDLAFLRALTVNRLAESFSQLCGIDHALATASLFAGFGHCLGGAMRIDTAAGAVEPPFSLLIVTPERDPVWPGIPVRFLADRFLPTMSLLNQAAGIREHLHPEDAAPRDGAPPKAQIEQALEAAKQLYTHQLAERVVSVSVRPPYPRPPFDHHVLLVNPPNGLLRRFRQMTAEHKIQLEHALTSPRPLSLPKNGVSSGVPSFFWTLSRTEFTKFRKENPWFPGLPALILEAESAGNPLLDPSGPVIAEIMRRSMDLFLRRHNAMGTCREISARDALFHPVRVFLARAQKMDVDESAAAPITPRQVAMMALRFCLLFTALEGKEEPDTLTVEAGLSLAKHLAARHCRTLSNHTPASAYSQVSAPDITNLGSLERIVYLRICERPGLTPTQLSRSFKRLNRPEREQTLIALVTRGLVRFDGGKIWKA